MKHGIESLVRLQATVRGFLARKHCNINQLPQNQLSDYRIFITGNDPEIKGLPTHPAEEQIALIGTSGFRSLALACALSQGIPKLIILDNSRYVVNFWRMARHLAEQSLDQSTFLCLLKDYAITSQCYREDLNNEFYLIETGMNKTDFHQVKKIIAGSVVLGQSWEDERLMLTLKNILDHHEIKTVYAYVSNIAACTNAGNPREADNILKNIQKLGPVIAIHTDLYCGRPVNAFLIDDHTPENLRKKLNLHRPGSQYTNKSNLFFPGSVEIISIRTLESWQVFSC